MTREKVSDHRMMKGGSIEKNATVPASDSLAFLFYIFLSKNILPLTFILGCTLLFNGCNDSSHESTQEYPRRPIKLIVPFAAGGGSDTFTRIVQKAVIEQELLEQPLVVINVPGAGGTIGSRRVKNARPDGYTLLVLHEGIITSQHANNANYGPEAFEPIAGTGQVGLVVAVAEDSKYKSMQDLMSDAKANPGTILFSANLGAPVHFAGLQMERAAEGAQFRYVQSGGGAKRLTALTGGHCQVTAFSLSEYETFKSAGIRALAFCGDERHAELTDVPTAVEQGFDVIATNMQFWWAPKGTSPEKIEFIQSLLQSVMVSNQVQTELSKLKMDPVFLEGEALQESLDDRSRRISEVSLRPTTALPNLPLIVGGIVVLLALLVAGKTWQEHVTSVNTGASLATRDVEPVLDSNSKPELKSDDLASMTPRTIGLLSGTIAMTIFYVGSLHFPTIGFETATAIFVLGVGMVLSGANLRKLPLLLSVALLLSVGLYHLMTQVFVTDLP